MGLGFFDESEDNPALVQTHSFPEGARHWFPSNDHPADKATSTIITTVRSDWKVLSNGMLKEKQLTGNDYLMVCESELWVQVTLQHITGTLIYQTPLTCM